MPLDDLADHRNTLHRDSDALAVLRAALNDTQIGPVALVSSFGAESVVLLHLAAQIDTAVPVIFLDTEMLFAESLAYQRDVAKALGLRDVRVITPDRNAILREDVDGLLHQANPDACCDLRKAAHWNRRCKALAAGSRGASSSRTVSAPVCRCSNPTARASRSTRWRSGHRMTCAPI